MTSYFEQLKAMLQYAKTKNIENMLQKFEEEYKSQEK
jgi:hypothetical protein